MGLLDGLKNTSPSGTATGGTPMPAKSTVNDDTTRTKPAPTPATLGSGRTA